MSRAVMRRPQPLVKLALDDFAEDAGYGGHDEGKDGDQGLCGVWASVCGVRRRTKILKGRKTSEERRMGAVNPLIEHTQLHLELQSIRRRGHELILGGS